MDGVNGVGGILLEINKRVGGKSFLKSFIEYVALSVTVVFLRAFKGSRINESNTGRRY